MRLAALSLLLAASAFAHDIDRAPGLSDSTRVSLLTMLPGDEVYSLFGHSALRIEDPASGIDRTYNFGTFSFEQPFFVARFLRGSLDYQLDTAPFWAELDKYRIYGRPIIEQTLALSPEAARALYSRLEVNALPENRAYRYDFFWDNCSTRMIDAVDSALVDVGQPQVSLPPVDDPRTFRELLDPYLDGTPAVDVGLHLALGSDGDRAATAREETFLPIELAAQFDRATIGGRPLVASRDTLFWVEGAGLPEADPPWPLLATWLLLGAGVAGTVVGFWGRRADALLFGLVGLAGVIFFLLWFATTHDVMGPNWNLLWAWPLHLGAAWALGRDRLGAGWRTYFAVVAGVAALTVALWLVLPQELPAAVFPIALLLGVRA
ncbi:MAG: DUF4105 domain-containing protein [Bacteroidota bacterium]